MNELTEAANHQIEAHAKPMIDKIMDAAVMLRKSGRTIQEQVQEALKAMAPEEPGKPKGQVSGSPRISRKMSAREIRRASGDFSNSRNEEKQLRIASEIHWFGKESTWEHIPANRAPQRVTAGRRRRG